MTFATGQTTVAKIIFNLFFKNIHNLISDLLTVINYSTFSKKLQAIIYLTQIL